MRTILLLVLFAAVALHAEDLPPNLPVSAAAAIASSGKTQARLAADYQDKLIVEQKKLIATLRRLSKDALERQDLDGAVAIKSEMSRLQALIDRESAGTPTDDELANILTSSRWNFYHHPGQFWLIKFSGHDQITEGSNGNESSWRIKDGKMEILNQAGQVFSRWTFDPSTTIWTSPPDSDVVCTVPQKMTPPDSK